MPTRQSPRADTAGANGVPRSRGGSEVFTLLDEVERRAIAMLAAAAATGPASGLSNRR